MITKITTVEELKQIFSEALLNETDKVTKISDGSVLNGLAYGVAKVGQKILKDVSLVESRLYPDVSTGENLDELAKLRGVSPRLSSCGSTVYVRVSGNPGVQYIPGVHIFSGSGINFNVSNITTIPENGFTYVKLSSQSKGEVSNVNPLVITKVNPIPSGHDYCINEFSAIGGRDFESDDDFRRRIKNEINILSRGTISYLEQVFRKIEPDILRVMNLGMSKNGELIIGVSSVNGDYFTQSQLDNLYNRGEDYFSMNELKNSGSVTYGIKIVNIRYYPIDVSFRVDLDNEADTDIVRKNIQINLLNTLDWRYFKDGDWIDWINLINSVRNTKGVRLVPDNNFYPRKQFQIPNGMLPQIRGFQMLNLKGEIIADFGNNLNPKFFPNVNDFEYQSTVLKSI